MSSHLSIATVTATLISILDEALDLEGGEVEVRCRRPDGKDGEGPPKKGINVFLYRVTPNPAFRSALLSRVDVGEDLNKPSKVHKKPVTGQNLHYLLSFHGSESSFEPQRYLGRALHALQEEPILTETRINTAINAHTEVLAGSILYTQQDQIKLTPELLSLEDMSKLWSVFFQTPYHLSLAYLASVVIIEPAEREVKTVERPEVYLNPDLIRREIPLP